ncbi:MAG: Ca2+-binding EF-hand superfamily protein/dienelactone hydrolase [Lentimonas sp.]|jgi:Ca2+-binding EF-hand superfamily protein/dienelactone hydrolase
MNKMLLIALGVSWSAGSVVANPGLVRMHENMDVNQRGVVTEAEFMDFWDNNFKRTDTNEDQVLNQSEASAQLLKLSDKNKDGRVTLSEYQQLRQTHFKGMDQDGNRTLTLAEMLGTAAAGKPAFAKPAGPNAGLVAANPHLVNLHQSMDTNQDGVVSRTEFLAYWANSFNQRDKNKDHQLSVFETGAGIMKKVDSDQNGVLTWEEEQVLRLEHWKTMDKNKDQNLTLLEMLESPAAKPAAAAGSTPGTDGFSAQRAKVAALSRLTTAPAMHPAKGFDSTDNLMAIYYEALDWLGQPTKVFAWLGMPDECEGTVPAVVLVHGGGGTAFKNWVQEWNARGYAAISIAVEGQVDRKVGKAWEQHAWAGPKRSGIYYDSAQPLEDQWMYHAVANTILANSLIRSIGGVDASRVGVMGISWGGVITSTVIGIDDRFAFAIPTYGCGALATAENHYGNSLGSNETYRQVWDPMLRLERAKMPSLWFSWPEDKHFPMDRFAASYGKVAGEHMVALVPKMGHGHGSGWVRPESYAFADSIVNGQGPWCVQLDAALLADTCTVTFQSTKALNAVMLVSTTDRGVSGERTWVETPATVVRNGVAWIATATLPTGSTAWFMNVKSGSLIASSDYQEVQ